MLLGKCIPERRSRDKATRDQDFAETPPRALLFGEGHGKVAFAKEARLEQDLTELTPYRICRIHARLYSAA